MPLSKMAVNANPYECTKTEVNPEPTLYAMMNKKTKMLLKFHPEKKILSTGVYYLDTSEAQRHDNQVRKVIGEWN